MSLRVIILIIGFLLLSIHFSLASTEIKDFFVDGQIVDGNDFYSVNVWNDATVDMIGGVVAWNINTYNTSTFNISGGDAFYFNLFDSSILNLSGGLYSAANVIFPGTATVNFYGRDLEWIIDSEKRVHGYWADDTEFLITLSRTEDATIVFHEIPEPCTFCLLSAGFLILRKRAKTLRR